MRAYQQSGTELGWFKSANESWTRVVVYISLMALYILGGSKVKAVSATLDFSCCTLKLENDYICCSICWKVSCENNLYVMHNITLLMSDVCPFQYDIDGGL